MEKLTTGKFYIKKNKVVEVREKFVYERCVYVIYLNAVYVINSKIIESFKFLEDSITYKKIENINYLISTELVGASEKWLNENAFTFFEGKLKSKRKNKENN